MLPTDSHLSLRRKDFLNTDLLNEVLTTQVNQMGSLLVVRQVRTDAVDHHHDESAIIHIKPIRTADEVIFTVPNEWTVKIDRQVGLIETCHGQRQPGDPEPAWSREACDTTQPHRIVASLVDADQSFCDNRGHMRALS